MAEHERRSPVQWAKDTVERLRPLDELLAWPERVPAVARVLYRAVKAVWTFACIVVAYLAKNDGYTMTQAIGVWVALTVIGLIGLAVFFHLVVLPSYDRRDDDGWGNQTIVSTPKAALPPSSEPTASPGRSTAVMLAGKHTTARRLLVHGDFGIGIDAQGEGATVEDCTVNLGPSSSPSSWRSWSAVLEAFDRRKELEDRLRRLANEDTQVKLLVYSLSERPIVEHLGAIFEAARWRTNANTCPQDHGPGRRRHGHGITVQGCNAHLVNGVVEAFRGIGLDGVTPRINASHVSPDNPKYAVTVNSITVVVGHGA